MAKSPGEIMAVLRSVRILAFTSAGTGFHSAGKLPGPGPESFSCKGQKKASGFCLLGGAGDKTNIQGLCPAVCYHPP